MADRPGGFEFAASPEALGFDSAGIDRLRSCMSGRVAGGQIAGGSFLLMRHGRSAASDVFGAASLETGALIFIGLIQRMADPVSAGIRAVTRKLTYEALTDRSGVHPEEST